MVLRPELLDAFVALGIAPESDQTTAAKAYKRLALIHHPDRNHGDSTATERFQQIGAAWNICQRHFDNPSWGHIPDAPHTHSAGFSYTFSTDDDIPLDEDELRAFYEFMFKETVFGRYSRSKGQRYRYERSGGAGAGVHTFSDGFAGSQARQAKNTERQRKENEDYEKRKRDLELEIEQEEKEHQNHAKKLRADEDRRKTALECAFQAACAGNSPEVRRYIIDFNLDVNAARRQGRQARRQEDIEAFDSLLHVAASHCDGALVMFLIERGAKTNTLNKNQLTPFHTAIKAGNTNFVRFVLERRGRSFEGYHPSKAASSGRTPLQLAIDSGVSAMVELLVKDATTHDVERCWKSESISEEIKQILRTKKGFVPPEEAVSTPLSKKSLRQQELAQQKLARMAEEAQRAAANRQKREERTAKQAASDRNQLAQEAQRKAQVEEYHRLEDKRKIQEAEIRAKEQEETRLRSEAELHARAKIETRAKAEPESHSKTQAEPKTDAKIELRTKTNAISLSNTATNASDDARPDHKVAGRKEDRTCIKKERFMNGVDTSNLPNSGIALFTEAAVLSNRSLTEDQKQENRRLKFKEKRKAKQTAKKIEVQSASTEALEQVVPSQRVPETISTTIKKLGALRSDIKDSQAMDGLQQTKHEAALRRRAEQSVRDKERHRRMVEERTKAASSVAQLAQHTLLAPTPTHATDKSSHERPKGSTSAQSLSPPPAVPQAAFTIIPMEDFQTCIVPDDLFRDERPQFPTARVSGTTPKSTTSSSEMRAEAHSAVDQRYKRSRKSSRRGRVHELLTAGAI